jgi:5-deoxy-glucuronate isomerase
MKLTRLRILELDGTEAFDTGGDELLVLPLAGSCSVTVDGERFELAGRESVFSAITDFAYAPRDARVEICGRGRFALPAAAARRRLEPRYRAAADVPVWFDGAGNMSRQLNPFSFPDVFEADALMTAEVLAPGGNWASYPPHRHDDIEEIFYFEVARGGIGYQRVYGGPDVLVEVRTGDIVEVPSGYHGPSMAVPGYDLYFLCAMSGPGGFAFSFSDDPEHAWIRATWEGLELDSRLPLTSATVN